MGREDPLEKEIANAHSSILALRIPWTDEPGGLQFMGGYRESDRTEQLSLPRLPINNVVIISCGSKGIQPTYMCIHSPPNSSPILAAT